MSQAFNRAEITITHKSTGLATTFETDSGSLQDGVTTTRQRGQVIQEGILTPSDTIEAVSLWTPELSAIHKALNKISAEDSSGFAATFSIYVGQGKEVIKYANCVIQSSMATTEFERGAFQNINWSFSCENRLD